MGGEERQAGCKVVRVSVARHSRSARMRWGKPTTDNGDGLKELRGRHGERENWRKMKAERWFGLRR